MKKITWVDVAVGVWLIASPLALGYSALRPVVVVEDFLPGVFLVATSWWILAGGVVGILVLAVSLVATWALTRYPGAMV